MQKETSRPVFLILGTSGGHGTMDHRILELPSQVAGEIVAKDLQSRLGSAGTADRTYFRVVPASA
ncbi:hypothetical protein JL100_008160 [Skermanella mucosa]|uniref:hypothetical protein n=1 Tax=Skermanella mucosa TaxID=1789672 RepID=UPI00192B7FCF|nr:hypothetical protein [Skermanella mucosa]UEM22706.1 hypothetical protein JL100_008160 [Skermanella mucosa]